MKASRFNILTKSRDDDSKVLLYNTLHDHRILFDLEQINPHSLFEKIKKAETLESHEQEVVDELKSLGLLLDDSTDEFQIFKNWYDEKIRERTDIMHVTILPTMKCNLACHYCFENEVRENDRMSPSVATQTISYLTRRLNETKPKKLEIMYFGGEPLLHPTPILKISEEMSKVCRELGVEMEIGMVSNGVLLTPEFVDQMIPFGFRWIKITFDGDRDAHDKKRIWHSGKATFDTIYDNLCAIKGKVKIAIGGNFDQENYPSMFQLVERLRQSPFAQDIMVARFKPIMDINVGLTTQREGRVSSMCEVCAFNSEQTNGIMDLQQKTFDEGIPIQDRPDIGPCEYHSRHAFTITPEGNIYKCPAFAGLSNLSAGHVADSANYNAFGEWQLMTRKWDDDCESCSYLPNCAGGCHMAALNKTGSLEVKSCDSYFLKRSTEEFMQRELKSLANSSKE